MSFVGSNQADGKQCLGCNRLLAPIDPYSAAIPAQSLLSRNLATLGDPILDPLSGITVEMRRIANPSATVMVYTLPDQSVEAQAIV